MHYILNLRVKKVIHLDLQLNRHAAEMQNMNIVTKFMQTLTLNLNVLR